MRLTMYKSDDPAKIFGDPVTQTGQGTNYTFYSCMTEGLGGRALSKLLASDGMTVSACLAAAEAKGYSWAGLEYGRECWMGNSLNNSPVNATLPTECSMACKGDKGSICGNASRLSMYLRNPGT
jgi:hypothetical protein